MRDYLELLSRFGPDFAAAIIQKLMAESNATTKSGQAYVLGDSLRQELVARVAVWKEAIIVHETMKQNGVDFPKPMGLKAIPPQG